MKTAIFSIILSIISFVFFEQDLVVVSIQWFLLIGGILVFMGRSEYEK